MKRLETLLVVKDKTRLEMLKERFSTVSQTKFYLKSQGSSFDQYQQEHDRFQQALDEVVRQGESLAKVKVVERDFLPNFIFAPENTILVLGRDGLVANTAKYAQGIPILGVNPDPQRYDGVLLPFRIEQLRETLARVAAREAFAATAVTMAQVKLNDGQRLLAFNDLFIGPATHTSARYSITHKGRVEEQSSSGIIVSTGAGSTGWLSSLFNMANGMAGTFGEREGPEPLRSLSKLSASVSAAPAPRIPRQAWPWDAPRLVFVVREPFVSKYSRADIAAGVLEGEERLVLESFMPERGVIFSDGIENDYLNFNSGSVATIGIAPEKALLVRPHDNVPPRMKEPMPSKGRKKG